MAARFKKSNPMGGGRVPIIPEVQPAYGASQIGVRNQSPMVEDYGSGLSGFLNKEFSKLEPSSAALWNVLSAIGGMAKNDAIKIKNDPIRTFNDTLDSLTIGQEARDRFKQGDYSGSIINSGAGQLFAMPEMEKVFKGQAGPMDALWLALTYGTGGASKAVKGLKPAIRATKVGAMLPAKGATRRGASKAYIDVLNRLP